MSDETTEVDPNLAPAPADAVAEAPADAPPPDVAAPQDGVLPDAPEALDGLSVNTDDPAVMEVADAAEVQEFRSANKVAGSHQAWERQAKTIDASKAPKSKVAREASEPAKVVEKKVGAGKKVAGVFMEDVQLKARESENLHKVKSGPRPKDKGGEAARKAAGSDGVVKKVAGVSA